MKLHFSNFHLEIRLYHTMDKPLLSWVKKQNSRLEPARSRVIKRLIRKKMGPQAN